MQKHKGTLNFPTVLTAFALLACSLARSADPSLQAEMNAVLKTDPRNSGVAVSVQYRSNPSVLYYDLRAVALTNSIADVFRVFLQFAQSEKSREFEAVELAFHGQPRFMLSGRYFKQLGEEFGTQNPVYTMRTFPENLSKPDGSRAYQTWTGGLLGVAGKQMEDFNDFHRQWWLGDLIAASVGGRTDSKTAPVRLSDTPSIRVEQQSQVLAPISSSESSPKLAHTAQNTFDAGQSRSSAPSSAPTQLPTWLSIFPAARDQVNTTTVGAEDVSYTAPVSPVEVISFYREGLNKRGVANHIGFNGVGTTIQASLDNESCVIRLADADVGTTVSVKCANVQSGRSAYAAAPVALPPLPPGVHRVEYSISGSARAAGLTYRNATGGTEQNDAALPGSVSFNAARGQFVYFSAQNKTGNGDVHVSITVDGRLLQQATSSTAYGIATASGRVPP